MKHTQVKDPNWPKMVYTAGLAEHMIIHCEEERPAGYYDHAEAKDMDPEIAAIEKSEKTEQAKAELAEEQAKREAKKAEKAYRKGIMEYLDEHNVDYAKNISTDKLEELKVALDEHLAHQDPPNDSDQ